MLVNSESYHGLALETTLSISGRRLTKCRRFRFRVCSLRGSINCTLSAAGGGEALTWGMHFDDFAIKGDGILPLNAYLV